MRHPTINFDIYLDSYIECDGEAGGWGLILERDGKVLSQYVGGNPRTTKKRAEKIALINALDLCLPQKQGHHFTIYTPSRSLPWVYNKWMKQWSENDEIDQKENGDLVRLLLALKAATEKYCKVRQSENESIQHMESTLELAKIAWSLTNKKVIPTFGKRIKLIERRDSGHTEKPKAHPIF